MHPIPAFSPPADGLFERIVARAVLEGGLAPDGARQPVADRLALGGAYGVGADAVVGCLRSQGPTVAVLRDGPGVIARVERLIGFGKALGVELIVLGGGVETREALRAAIPTYAAAGVTLRHYADDGSVEVLGTVGAERTWLEGPHPAPDWDAFWAVLRGQSAGRVAFQQGVTARGTPATFILLGVNVAVYLLELYYGGPTYTPVIVRMGALMRDRVLEGEVWRVVTSVFLHASWAHLGFNMLVLWGLGKSLEQILGTSRFVLVYGLAALGGSACSLLLVGQLSVGASGALWGLMAAQLVLALRGRGVLPEGLRAAMQRGALINFGINVMNSMRPGVDWAAHAGGGVVGVALGALGALTLGLPRWAEVREGEEVPPDRVPGFVTAGAGVLGSVLGIGLLAGLALGGVWKLNAPPVLRAVPIGTSGWSADVPDLLGMVEAAEADVVFGDIQADPVLIEVIVLPFDEPFDADARAALVPELALQLAAPEDTFTITGEVSTGEADGATLLVASYAGPNGFRLSRALAVRDVGITRVDLLYVAETPAVWTALASPIALSGKMAAGAGAAGR